MRLMSASIAATARHYRNPRRNQSPHGDRETGDPLACSKSVVDEGDGERAGQSDPEHDRETTDLIFQGHSLASFLRALINERTACAGSDFTCTGL